MNTDTGTGAAPPSAEELWRRLEALEATHSQILRHLLELVNHNTERRLPTPEAARWAEFERHHLPRYRHARELLRMSGDDFPSARAEHAETLDRLHHELHEQAALLGVETDTPHDQKRAATEGTQK